MHCRKAIPTLLAFPAALVVVLAPAPAANADTTKCSTDYNLYNSGSTTTCNIFTNDGGWNITTT